MAVTSTRVREMDVRDIQDVLELEHECFPVPWTKRMLEDELAARGRVYLVVEDDDVFVAYGGLMVVEDDAHLMTLAVAPHARRRGIATRLMLRLVEQGLEKGAAHLTLELRSSNRAARGLYEKFGFTQVGVRRQYYPDEDALVMWALDADGEEYAQRLRSIREEAA